MEQRMEYGLASSGDGCLPYAVVSQTMVNGVIAGSTEIASFKDHVDAQLFLASKQEM